MLEIDRKYNMKLTRGDTAYINISLEDEDETTYEFVEGDTMFFRLAANIFVVRIFKGPCGVVWLLISVCIYVLVPEECVIFDDESFFADVNSVFTSCHRFHEILHALILSVENEMYKDIFGCPFLF